MHITDYGRIFIPQEWGIDYCKSPHAVVYDDYIRIYYSYCVPDGAKLKSRVGYVDYDKEFNSILNVSNEVMADGNLGCFDEHGIFPFSPFWDNGKLMALTGGWSRRKSVSVDTGIGLAYSDDAGKTFNRYGNGPILSSSLNEPFLVIDGYMVKHNDKYIMFYIYGTDWKEDLEKKQPERTYKIGYATSDNMLDWNKAGAQIIPDKLTDESQALPCVVYWKNRWYMFFCYRESRDFRDNNIQNNYRLGCAISDDLVTWKRKDESIKIITNEWNSTMQCYPNAFLLNGDLYLLYNGDKFGKYGFGLLRIEGEIDEE